MTYSIDFCWRAIALIHVYSIPVSVVSSLLGPKPRTLSRWYALYLRYGTVNPVRERIRSNR
ncbi:TPA: hypothetical protein N0F65_001710 [Lagenidium giganteum]|uniref:Transposase n=1 Tax=Lagenidium giganteum TaxID=4803 RepID=A0AAV2Z5S0_9STRA|nr:TPA: hypothetical protein N0F65_001710 [Lagenidium giganteum]